MSVSRTITHRHIGIGDITFHNEKGPIPIAAKNELELRFEVAASADLSIQQVAAVHCAITQELVGVEVVTSADYGRIQQECLENHWIFESQIITKDDEL